MSTIRDGRISTVFTYSRVKAIPQLHLQSLHRVHSAGSISVASTASCTPSEKVQREHIRADEPCFITKTPGYALQKVHLVNVVRKNKPERARVVRPLVC